VVGDFVIQAVTEELQIIESLRQHTHQLALNGSSIYPRRSRQ